jgi:hypothetical protein
MKRGTCPNEICNKSSDVISECFSGDVFGEPQPGELRSPNSLEPGATMSRTSGGLMLTPVRRKFQDSTSRYSRVDNE